MVELPMLSLASLIRTLGLCDCGGVFWSQNHLVEPQISQFYLNLSLLLNKIMKIKGGNMYGCCLIFGEEFAFIYQNKQQ